MLVDMAYTAMLILVLYVFLPVMPFCIIHDNTWLLHLRIAAVGKVYPLDYF
jgi:hypothetical protein